MPIGSDSNDILITVKVDAEKATQVLQKLGDEVTVVSSKAGEGGTGFSKFGSELASFRTVALGVAGALAAIGGSVFAISRLADLGDQINDVAGAFTRLTGGVESTAQALLGDLQTATNNTVNNLDLFRLANEALIRGIDPTKIDDLFFSAQRFAEQMSIPTTQAVDQFINAIARGTPELLKKVGALENGKIALDQFTSASATAANETGGLGDAFSQFFVSLENAKGALAQAIDNSVALKAAFSALLKFIEQNIERTALLTINLIELADSGFNYVTGTIEKASDGLAVFGDLASQLAGGSIPDIGKAIDKVASKKLADFLDNKKLAEVKKTYSELPKSLTQLANEYKKTTAFQFEQLSKLKNEKEQRDLITEAATRLNDALLSGQITQAQFNKGVSDLERQYINAGVAAEQLFSATEQGAQNATQAIEDQRRALEDLHQADLEAQADKDARNSAIASTGSFGIEGLDIVGLISGGANIALSGASGEQAAAQTGQLIGQTIGAIAGSFFGPAGTVIGGLLGGILGEVAGGLLHSEDSKGTAARKALDRYFADLFSADRLSIIVNGELKKIDDLSFAEFTNKGTLASLPDDVEQIFAGIGIGFEGLAGSLEDFGFLGDVLAGNLAGNLNNLQLFIQASGKSLEELREAITDTFLDGQISAIQAVNAFSALEEIFTEGIPGALGDTTQAFENLIAAGPKGGRAVIDAIKDIFAEAKELNLNSFAAVQQNLLASGKFSAEQIQQVFDALKAIGIDTFEELEGASTETLIAAIANLEAIGFAFKEPKEEAEAVAEEINNLPATKKVELQVSAKYFNGARETIDYIQGKGEANARSYARSLNDVAQELEGVNLQLRYAAETLKEDIPDAAEETGDKLVQSMFNSTNQAIEYVDNLETAFDNVANGLASLFGQAQEFGEDAKKQIEDLSNAGATFSQQQQAAAQQNSGSATSNTVALGRAFSLGNVPLPPHIANQPNNRIKDEAEAAFNAALEQADAIRNLATQNKRYEEILDAVANKETTIRENRKELNTIYNRAERLLIRQIELERKYGEALAANLNGSLSDRELNRVRDRLEKINEKIDQFTGSSSNLAGGGGEGTAQVNEGLLNFLTKYSDNLNLVSVAATAAGISIKQLQDAAIQDFLSGKLDPSEAVKKLSDLGPGIAGKLGATAEAFKNVIEFGVNGGRLTTDALRDIFAEAKEGAAVNLDDVREQLLAQGVDRELVDKLFIATTNEGINSLEQGLGLTEEQAIQVLEQLQQLSFPFQETSDEIRALNDELSLIPESKTVTINLDANISPELAEILSALYPELDLGTSYGNSGDAPGLVDIQPVGFPTGGGLVKKKTGQRARL